MLVDFHTHISPPWFRERLDRYRQRDLTVATLFANPHPKMATAKEIIRRMDRDGVETAVVMGAGWCDKELAMAINDYIMESAARYPNRLIGFCSINPAWGEDALAEVERCARGGVKGIGELHPDTQEFDLADAKLMAPLVSLTERLGLIILTHSSEPVGHHYAGKGRTTPDVLYRFIKAFPQARVVCAHWGGGLPFYALMPEVEQALSNVYFDTAVSPFLYRPEVFNMMEGIVGAKSILMGSDYPMVQPRHIIEQVEASFMSAEAKASILGDNASTLLGLR